MWRNPLYGDCITEAQGGWSERQEGPTARQWTSQVFCLNSVSPTTAGERLGGVHVLWGAVLPRLGASGGGVRGSELGGGARLAPVPSPLRRPRRSAERDRWRIEHFSSFGDFRGFSVNRSPGPPLPSTSGRRAPPHDPVPTVSSRCHSCAPQHPAQDRPLSCRHPPGEDEGWRGTNRARESALCRVEEDPGRWGAGTASWLSGGPSGRRTRLTGLEEQRLGLRLPTPLSIPPCLESCLHFPSQAWPAASSKCSGYFCCLLLFPVGLPSPATPVPSSAENRWFLLSPQGVSSHSTCAGTRNTQKGSNLCRIIPPKHV